MRQLGMLGLVAFGLASATESLAAPKPPLKLEPTTKWTVDYSPEACRLLRGFGPEDNRVTLILKQNQPGTKQSVTVTGRMFFSREVRTAVAAGFSPGPTPKEQDVATATIGPSKLPALLLGTMDLDVRFSDSIAPGDLVPNGPLEFRLAGPAFTPVNLQLGAMKPALAAMRKCTDALVTEWGYDPGQQTRLARRPSPKTSPGSWLNSRDYPKDAAAEGWSGDVFFRMAVDETGMPTKCVIQQETSPPLFGEFSCKALLKRAKFLPALDEAGKPVASYFVSQVRWFIK